MFSSVDITPTGSTGSDGSENTGVTYMALQFQSTPNTATLINDNFQLYPALVDDDNRATTTAVTDPFEPIDLQQHYNSISRILYLFFQPDTLVNDQFYTLYATTRTVTGQDRQTSIYFAFGAPGAYDQVRFADVHILPAIEELPADDDYINPPDVPTIEDHSLRLDVFDQLVQLQRSSGTSDELYVEDSDPEQYTIFVEPDHQNGRITIDLNMRPSYLFLTNQYFRVQKKPFEAHGTTRWQTLDTILVRDFDGSVVHIYLPSTDDAPVYGEPDATYFESGHKYRIKVSGEIGS